MVFYRSFYEAIENLPNKNKLNVLTALFEYALNGFEMELSGVDKTVFLLVKPQIDANNKRYQNGSKGGRPKTKTKPKSNRTKTKGKPNVNDNVNENVNANDKDVVPFSNNKKLNDTFTEFIAYRRAMEKPLMDTSIERLTKKLNSYSVDVVIKALEMSMENGWQGVFPEKISDKVVKKTNFSNFNQRNYDFKELEKELLTKQLKNQKEKEQ